MLHVDIRCQRCGQMLPLPIDPMGCKPCRNAEPYKPGEIIMMTQADIDAPEKESPLAPWWKKILRGALAVGSKEPKFSPEEWDFIASCLDLIAEDNAEVIGSFDDADMDARLAETAERALLLSGRIKEGNRR